MKTLERYVFKTFVASFLLAFLVLSFVLTIGLTVQIAGYIVDGAPIKLVGQFAAVSFPEAMQITAPTAFLVSSYLVFSRLSSDSEIAAMRACGVNIWRVMIWPIAFAGLFSLACAWLNNEIVPRGHEIRRALATRVSSARTALDMFKPGTTVAFEGFSVYAGGKEGNVLYDVIVTDEVTDPKVTRTCWADRVVVEEDGDDLVLELDNPRIYPFEAGKSATGRADKHIQRFTLRKDKIRRKLKDLRFFELLDAIGKNRERVEQAKNNAALPTVYEADDEDEKKAKTPKELLKNRRRDLSKAKVELSKRFVIALASVCFVMVGIPLGLRAQRKETTIGMAYALLTLLGYFGWWYWWSGSLQKVYAVHPEIFIWLPVPVCMAVSMVLARKNQ